MNSERYERIQGVFNEIADAPAEMRESLLRGLCGGDAELIATVSRMLDEDDRGASLLEADLADALKDFAGAGLVGGVNLGKHAFGPYRLVRLLGEGGMGVVYLAEREDLDSHAAIKILRDSALSPMRRQRFASEQKMLAHLNHPSIARLYDADTLEDGTPYIVMEFVEGEQLTGYVQNRNSSIDAILKLFRSICDAVQYAHAQGIIHRDLKPSNILVTQDGTVKLLDFGISKQLQFDPEQDRQTITALRLMTPAYAAPEQVRGELAGIQVDVYSLGVILYELLAGRLPFNLSDQTPGQVERILTEELPKPPSAHGRLRDGETLKLPRLAWSELDTLCLTAMHSDPKRRYASVEALARDVDHYLQGEPLEARPDSFRYRAAKFLSRHGRVVAWAAAAVLVMFALAVFAAVRIAKARQETAAEAARKQQIQRFMLNLFKGGEKQTGPSEDLRVTTLLDRGVQQAQMLDEDPETAAELSQTLAGIYENLGKLDNADALLQSAMMKRTKMYGPESPRVAETMTELGLLRLDQGNPKEAERLTRAALEIDQRTLPASDPAIARATSAVGRVMVERGAYKDAIPLLEQSVRMQSGKPELAADLATSVTELADANYYSGHFNDADLLNRQALGINEKLYGTRHPTVADTYLDLGEIQHDLGHDGEAEKFYRRALDIDKSWYGESNPNTAFCMMAVGQSLIYQKRYDDAAPFIQQSLVILEQVFGPSNAKVAMAVNLTGLLAQRRGDLTGAEKAFTRMAEINRAIYGDRHYLVGIAVLNLAQVYLDEKRFSLAEETFRGALDRFREQLPADHLNIGIAEQKLGATLVQEGKYENAETTLLDAHRIFGKQSPQPAARVAAVLKDLITASEHLHQGDKAVAYRAELQGLPSGDSAIKK